MSQSPDDSSKQILGISGGIIGGIMAAAIGCWQAILVVFVFYGLCLFGNPLTGMLYAHLSCGADDV